jgi:hypothetical protein
MVPPPDTIMGLLDSRIRAAARSIISDSGSGRPTRQVRFSKNSSG